MPRVAQRDRRGASDEVVCVLADAFGFESADDYGRANEATLPRLRAQARRARALAKVNAFVSRHGLAFSPPISRPTISEQQVINPFWLRRRLDSVQQILSHVRLDSTHGASVTATSPAGLARCRNAADRARRVRLRQVVSADETAAAQNEPLADEQQRVLDTSAPHTPSHHHYCQHHHYNQHAAQQQLEQERQRKWLNNGIAARQRKTLKNAERQRQRRSLLEHFS